MTGGPSPPPGWGLEEVTEEVSCGGAGHRVRWADGGVAALDHPDPDGERLLGGLGATKPFCLAVLDAWSAHSDDLRVLALGPRHAADMPGLSQEALAGIRYGNFARSLANQRSQLARLAEHRRDGAPDASAFLAQQEDSLRRHESLLSLFTLGAALQHRLCVGVASASIDRLAAEPEDPGRPALVAALMGRAAPVVRRWSRGVATVRSGPAAMVDRKDDGVEVVLAFEWLRDVWGPALSLIDDKLVIEASYVGAGSFEVTAVGPGGGPTSMRAVPGDDHNRWRLEHPLR